MIACYVKGILKMSTLNFLFHCDILYIEILSNEDVLEIYYKFYVKDVDPVDLFFSCFKYYKMPLPKLLQLSFYFQVRPAQLHKKFLK